MEMQECSIADMIFKAYRFRFLRKSCLSFLMKFEGGEFFSITLRRILENYYGITINDYSYGHCMVPGKWPAGITVGRFVSIGPEVQVFSS